MIQRTRSLNTVREDIHAALRSTQLSSAITQFDRLWGSEGPSRSDFAIPVLVRTVNRPNSITEAEITRPKLTRDPKAYILGCGFRMREGTFAGAEQGELIIPKEGLAALSFLLEKIPGIENEGREFFKRSLSLFGKKVTVYGPLARGLTPSQIAAGMILLKVTTEGLSGLNGDLFLNKNVILALEGQMPGSSEEVLSKMLSIQEKVLEELTQLVR